MQVVFNISGAVVETVVNTKWKFFKTYERKVLDVGTYTKTLSLDRILLDGETISISSGVEGLDYYATVLQSITKTETGVINTTITKPRVFPASDNLAYKDGYSPGEIPKRMHEILLKTG